MHQDHAGYPFAFRQAGQGQRGGQSELAAGHHRVALFHLPTVKSRRRFGRSTGRRLHEQPRDASPGIESRLEAQGITLEGHVAQADFQPLRLDLLPLALRLQGAKLGFQLRIHPAQDLWRQGGLHLRSEHDVEAVPLSGHEVTVGAPGFRQGVGLLRLHPDRPQDAHRRQQTRI